MTKTLKTVSALAIAAATLTAATLVTGNVASANTFLHLGHGPVSTFKLPPVYQKFGNGLNITCLACRLPRPMPVGPGPSHNWNHGWNHGFGWRNREIFVGGVAVAAPAQIAAASVAAPSQVAAGPCNCLTKQDLPDGGVLFQDICTKQTAIASPQTLGAR